MKTDNTFKVDFSWTELTFYWPDPQKKIKDLSKLKGHQQPLFKRQLRWIHR